LKDIVIAGGGLAGLISAICLADAGLSVSLVEKKAYPFHKVCGEYVSNEVLPFLESIGCFPAHLQPSRISRFRLSDHKGNQVGMPLDLGGFGISRYQFDHYLYQQARARGVECLQRTQLRSVEGVQNGYRVGLSQGKRIEARMLIGAWGKRSSADKALNRPFFRQRTDYIGVKYHIRAALPHDEVALHNFPGGYCGIVKIEDNTWNMCYLGSKERLRHWGSLEAMEKHDLGRNPLLRDIMQEAEFLHERPEVINEINFTPKKSVAEGVLMVGDTAGLITPLCGNGMAMAIHSAKLLADLIVERWPLGAGGQQALEKAYKNAWQKEFARRLWVGRQTQKLFGNAAASSLAVMCMRYMKPLGYYLMQHTHGRAF
jgi:flavin-dependent dehydrogenase